MKKTVIITISTIVMLTVLYKSGVISALGYFILVGVVPGTNYAVPSTFMLLLMTSVAWVCLFSFLPINLVKNSTNKKQPKRPLPKRRYGRI